jgi:hypothetical protein
MTNKDLIMLKILVSCKQERLYAPSVHKRLGGDLNPNFVDARASPPPFLYAPASALLPIPLLKSCN